MKTRLLNAWRWFISRLPEVLLVLFLLSFVPLIVMVARQIALAAIALVASPAGFFQTVGKHPWQSLAAVVCVVGVTALVVVLWRNWSFVWAVARKMILEAIHRKVVMILLLFFVVLMPSLPFILKTEGSLKSQVQIVLLYSLVLSMFLLALMAIFVSTASICSEVERKHVHITDTKPLRRWQFLLGKWLGVVIMCAAVLYSMGAGGYFLVLGLIDAPDYSEMTAGEVGEARSAREQVFNEVLVGRKAVTAPLPDVSEEIDAEVERLRELGKLSPYVYSFRQTMRQQILSQYLSVPPGGSQRWDFAGLEPREDEFLQVRFRGYYQGGEGIYGRWSVGRVEQPSEQSGEEDSQERLVRVWGPVYAPQGGWRNNTAHELMIPAELLSPEGTLTLIYENVDPRLRLSHSVIFDIKHPVEVLQRQQGFLPNYYRALLIILVHIALLAALGLTAGALFSFPVAALVVSCLFVGGLIGPWFGQFVQPDIYKPLTSTSQNLDIAWRMFARIILSFMPNFGSYSPMGSVVGGRMVTWGQVSAAGAVLLLVKGGVALLLGMYFYTRRELARIIV